MTVGEVVGSEPTEPRCMCGQAPVDLGPIFPDALHLAANYPFECARGAGSNGDYSWCRETWVLVIRVKGGPR